MQIEKKKNPAKNSVNCSAKSHVTVGREGGKVVCPKCVISTTVSHTADQKVVCKKCVFSSSNCAVRQENAKDFSDLKQTKNHAIMEKMVFQIPNMTWAYYMSLMEYKN